MSDDTSPIYKLNSDCLELIFKACDGCPFTLCTLTEVCYQWYAISQRPSVWRTLVINKPSLHAAYRRFLSSEQNAKRLQAVRSLTVVKPVESRHAHLQPLPFTYMKHITHLHTMNLCLAEIDYLSQQIVHSNSKLHTLVSKNIETWCNTRQFSSDMIRVHQDLSHVEFQFSQDGHSGFASIHNKSIIEEQQECCINSFSLTSIRDDEFQLQRNVLLSFEGVEIDRMEVYYQYAVDHLDQQNRTLVEMWHQIEQRLVEKYQFLTSLNNLERLEFGFCNTWTPMIWRDQFKKVISASPGLTHLSLHGWDQLGKLISIRSSTMEPIRADAESAIAESFELMSQLRTLQLVDFYVGPGLLKGAKFISKTIQHIEIIFTMSFPREFIGLSLTEFVASAFSGAFISNTTTRSAVIRFHPNLLIEEFESNPFHGEDPIINTMIQESFQDLNIRFD